MDKKRLWLGAAALVLLGYVSIALGISFIYMTSAAGSSGRDSKRKSALHSARIALIYVCFALRAMRWQVFQKNLGKAEFWSIYRMTLAGFAAVFVLGRAGEPVRPLLLSRKAKIPVADTFGITCWSDCSILRAVR